MIDPLEEITVIERFDLLVDIYSGDLQKARRDGERLALANAQRIVAKHMRAEDPRRKAAAALEAACILAGVRPAKPQKCRDRIRSFLPEGRVTVRELNEALCKAKERRRA